MKLNMHTFGIDEDLQHHFVKASILENWLSGFVQITEPEFTHFPVPYHMNRLNTEDDEKEKVGEIFN